MSYHSEWAKRNPEKIKAAQQRHRAKNIDAIRESNRIAAATRRAADPEYALAYAREYRRKNLEKRRAYDRAYRLKNIEKFRAKDREQHAKHAEKRRARAASYAHEKPQIRRAYLGYPEPTRPRPENCECCGEQKKTRNLSLDHCHATGKFRGWLCHRCNLGIGYFKDSLELLSKATAYLERSK